MDDEEDREIVLPLRQLGFMYYALGEASRMLDAVLNHGDVATPAKRLAIYLDDIESNSTGMDSAEDLAVCGDIFLALNLRMKAELAGDGRDAQLQFRWTKSD